MRRTKAAKHIWPCGQRGVTLIELLIALVLTAIIGGALYQGLVHQSRSFIQQDQTAEALQHCREATEQILREIRMAGYGMAYQDASNNTINDLGIVLGTATLINGTSVTTNGETDSLVIRRGDSIPWTVWKYKFKYIDAQGVEKTKVTYDEKITARFGDPDFVMLISVDKKEYRTGRVRHQGMDDEYASKKHIRIEEYTGHLVSTNGLTTDYEGGTCVKFKEVAFYIDTSSGIPTLMKAVNSGASQIVARYIQDLQIAYQDSAGVWYRGGTGTTQSDPPVINNIRNVRISVLARASTASLTTPYFHAALEDGNRHPATGSDGFARRSLTAQVRARNFGVD